MNREKSWYIPRLTEAVGGSERERRGCLVSDSHAYHERHATFSPRRKYVTAYYMTQPVIDSHPIITISLNHDRSLRPHPPF